MLSLLVVAASLGLNNLAASIAIGVSSSDRSVRVRVAVVFGAFETAMPLVGLLIGSHFAHALGGQAHLVGGGLLVLVGAQELIGVRCLRTEAPDAAPGPGEQRPRSPAELRPWRLVALGAALSIDNLVVGFALGTGHSPLGVAVVTIGVVSIALSMVGLELGGRLGAAVGRRGELIGATALVLVGAAVAAKVL